MKLPLRPAQAAQLHCMLRPGTVLLARCEKSATVGANAKVLLITETTALPCR